MQLVDDGGHQATILTSNLMAFLGTWSCLSWAVWGLLCEVLHVQD